MIVTFLLKATITRKLFYRFHICKDGPFFRGHAHFRFNLAIEIEPDFD